MKYFNTKRRFSAIVRKFEGKMVKVKQARESVRKPMCIVTLDVLITKAMKDNFPPRVLSFLGQGEKIEGDPHFNKLEVDWNMLGLFKLYGRSTHSDNAKPQLEKGHDNDDAKMQIKKFFVVEEDEFMQIKLILNKCDKTWEWGGRVFGDGEVVIEAKPLQSNLPGMDDSQPADDEEEGE